jgi:transposase
MRLPEYGRNPNKRKAYVPHPALLLVGVEVSKAKHKACMGTQTTLSCRTLAFPHTREGFRRFEQPLQAHRVKNGRQPILIAMAPSGLYGQALYARLQNCGYEVCLGHGQAVRNNRTTMPDGTSKTDAKEAARVCD